MSSVLTTATLNYQLTNFAVGFMNDLASVMSLAERLSPTTPVPGSTGQYKVFNDKNSFLPEKTPRALGGDPTLIAFQASDGTYSCKPQALEVRVDKEEENAAGSAGGGVASQLLDEGKIRALLNKKALSHVKDVADFVLANTTAVAGRGNWSNPDIDPIDQIDEQLLALSLACGSTQNIKVTLDTAAWAAVRANAKVKARSTGVQVQTVSLEQFAGMLIFPVDLQVANVVYDANALGLAASKTRILASVALLHYSVPGATLYDPSPFKTFTVGPGGMVAGVRSYIAPNELWRGHIVDWSRDIKQTSTQSMIRLNIT